MRRTLKRRAFWNGRKREFRNRRGGKKARGRKKEVQEFY